MSGFKSRCLLAFFIFFSFQFLVIFMYSVPNKIPQKMYTCYVKIIKIGCLVVVPSMDDNVKKMNLQILNTDNDADIS